jgi:hypothetical protein
MLYDPLSPARPPGASALQHLTKNRAVAARIRLLSSIKDGV